MLPREAWHDGSSLEPPAPAKLSAENWIQRVEAKPIFRPDVIRLPLLGYSPPEHVAHLRPKFEKWAEIIAIGSDDAHKERGTLAISIAYN